MCLIVLIYGGLVAGPRDYIATRLSNNTAHFDYENIRFAGEPVILDERNISGIQKLEKELLLTQFNIPQFLLYHKRAPLYFPYIESVLFDHGVPQDFKYLPLAESGLNNKAVSSAGAVGIWQFIPETARRFGLRVDEYIDERLHFEKATRAAVQYLAYIHDRVERSGYDGEGSWALAAAGYNRGESGILADLEGQPTATGYYDLILNRETARYVYRIIAIKLLMESRERMFSEQVLDRDFEMPQTKKRKITGPVLDLRVWSLERDLDYYEIRELNPWIK